MALDLVRDAEGAVVGVTALEMETGELHVLAGQGGAARDRRRGPHLRGVDQRLHQHRRRPRHGGARRPAARGHGVLAVPPDRRLRRRRAAHRRLPRRGRDPAQRQRRALHGALRADAEGPRAARLRLALHGPGDQGRARLRPAQGLHRPRHDAPRRRDDQEAPAERARDRPQLRQRRHHARADPGRADDPLPDGRRADQRPRPGRRRRRAAIRTAVVPGLYAVGECSCVSVHGANRLGTNSLLDLLVFGRAAGNHIVASQAGAAQAHRPLPAHAHDFTAARAWRGSTRAPAASTRRRSPTTCGRRCSVHAGVFRTQASMDEGVGKVQAIAERAWSMHLADKSKIFNTARVEALEVDNLMESALATMVSAAARARVPRRAHGLRLRAADRRSGRAERAQRRRVDEAHALVQRRQPARLQAGEPEAADRRVDTAEGAHLLIMANEPTPSASSPRLDSIGAPVPTAKTPAHASASTATTPRTAPRRRMQTMQVELDGSERMLLDALMKLKEIDPSLSFSALVPRGRVRLGRDEHQRQERPGVPHQHEDARRTRSS